MPKPVSGYSENMSPHGYLSKPSTVQEVRARRRGRDKKWTWGLRGGVLWQSCSLTIQLHLVIMTAVYSLCCPGWYSWSWAGQWMANDWHLSTPIVQQGWENESAVVIQWCWRQAGACYLSTQAYHVRLTEHANCVCSVCFFVMPLSLHWFHQEFFLICFRFVCLIELIVFYVLDLM